MCVALADEQKTHPPQQLSAWLDMLVKAKVEIGIPDAMSQAFSKFGNALDRHLSEGSVRQLLSGGVGCVAVAGQLMEFMRSALPHFPAQLAPLLVEALPLRPCVVPPKLSPHGRLGAP